jgi:hypothetical protein
MTDFEKFATDHTAHNHCSGCGGCILDPRATPQLVISVWCLGCYKRIEENMPVGAFRPWGGGVVYAQEDLRL